MERENAYLMVTDAVTGRSIVPLVPDQRVALGRAPTNHVVVHDERASRFHAEIFQAAGGWTVRDLQSRNGTFVGGQPLAGDRVLQPGDVVSIGQTEVVFREGDPPKDFSNESVVEITREIPADLKRWSDSITHRCTKGRLLEDISETAAHAPRVGRAAAELCRLAFALARAPDAREVARSAVETAVDGLPGSQGLILLADPRRAGSQATIDSLEVAASSPEGRSVTPVHEAAAATLLAADEAVLAGDGISMIAAPIRVAGRPIGVMLLESCENGPRATPDDLQFAMAVCDAIGVAIENLSTREDLSQRLATTSEEIDRLRRRLGEDSRMVGASAAIDGIVGQVAMVAKTKATVLVRGESGVGKELVARAIHEASEREKSPFVCLNCAALSETLLESELFGHEKGAFTGATERKIGKFEAADKGTLFLDEIGEMSPAIQAKFLRVLEGHPFERVGGSNRVKVDVRVVAATNRNLEDAVVDGTFRKDLYFRLKVVEILVPPLRKRPEDVPGLSEHFLARFAEETRRRFLGFTPAAVEALRGYHWPGNVRELRNVIERAVVLSRGEVIDVGDLALVPLGIPDDTDAAVAVNKRAYVPETLEEVEHRHVMATIEAVGGNKTKAAGILGIERSTLDRKLARWAAKA